MSGGSVGVSHSREHGSVYRGRREKEGEERALGV